MKKMIKTAAVIMSTIMVFSMTACAKKADPKEVFDAAVKKNSELTSLDMDTTMKMTMTQGEETMDITVDMNMKMSNMNEDSMQYLADTKTSLMGQSMDARIFYKDGYYYMDGMGQKIKYPMDLTELMESVKQSTESTNLQSEQMKEITMAKEGDSTILTFTADPEKMNAYLSEVMGSMSGMGTMDGMEMTFKEASGTYTVNKDGFYTDMTMKMSVDMAMEGESISMVLDLTGKVNNPGQDVTVEFPDTEGYTEVEMPAAQ